MINEVSFWTGERRSEEGRSMEQMDLTNVVLLLVVGLLFSLSNF